MRDTSFDETNIGRFRNFLEENNLAERIFGIVRRILQKKNLVLRDGTCIDATIIRAHTSTKNKDKKRCPETELYQEGGQTSSLEWMRDQNSFILSKQQPRKSMTALSLMISFMKKKKPSLLTKHVSARKRKRNGEKKENIEELKRKPEEEKSFPLHKKKRTKSTLLYAFWRISIGQEKCFPPKTQKKQQGLTVFQIRENREKPRKIGEKSKK